MTRIDIEESADRTFTVWKQGSGKGVVWANGEPINRVYRVGRFFVIQDKNRSPIAVCLNIGEVVNFFKVEDQEPYIQFYNLKLTK